MMHGWTFSVILLLPMFKQRSLITVLFWCTWFGPALSRGVMLNPFGTKICGTVIIAMRRHWSMLGEGAVKVWEMCKPRCLAGMRKSLALLRVSFDS
jgi:hypothetical protein